MNDQMRQLIDRITKEWADRGLIMEGGWQAFLATGMPPSASALQKSEMRKAYYLGAQHLFVSMLTMFDPVAEPTDKDLQRMDLIHKELDRFIQELNRETPPTGP